MEPKVFYWMGNHDGCGWYRGMLPGYYAHILKDVGGFPTSGSIQPTADMLDYNIVVLQRRVLDADISKIKELRKMGKVLVVDMDDNLLNIPYSNPAHNAYDSNLKKNIVRQLKEADLITVSTEYLGEELRVYNKNVFVFPNAVEMDGDWVGKDLLGVERGYSSGICRTESNGRKVRIGWVGSITHDEDLREVNHVLLDLVRDREDVEILYMGSYPEHVLAYLIEKGLIVRGENKKYQIPTAKIGLETGIWLVEGVHISKYYGKLLSLGLHIGIAPLVDNNFNRCKSNIKYLEYTMAGIPVIASNVLPYSSTIKDGEDGIIVKKGRYNLWKRALESLIENEKERIRLWENAKMKVIQHYDIRKKVLLYKKVYQGLLN